jgi:hypothetical protein
MSFVQQEQLGSGKRFVEMFSHTWIQIGITRSKDDADGPIKGLEERYSWSFFSPCVFSLDVTVSAADVNVCLLPTS